MQRMTNVIGVTSLIACDSVEVLLSPYSGRKTQTPLESSERLAVCGGDSTTYGLPGAGEEGGRDFYVLGFCIGM